nr:SMP-30/gluconolactonase/LRE family protein [Rhizobiaceae bacterium]
MSVSVLSGAVCHLGEGPTFDVTSQTLFWFDILGRRLYEHRLIDGRETAHDLPFMASALAAIDGDRQLIVAEDGLHVRDRITGRLMRRVAVEENNPVTRSNDSRTHPCGALWFGWYFEGEVRRLYDRITIPNGICFSPDGRTAYFTDTTTDRYLRVDVDPKTGLPQGDPGLFFDNTGRGGGLDGSVCDG